MKCECDCPKYPRSEIEVERMASGSTQISPDFDIVGYSCEECGHQVAAVPECGGDDYEAQVLARDDRAGLADI